MRRILQLLLSVTFLLSGEDCMAQGKEKLNAPVTLRGCIGIPKPITSEMFRTSFTGIYEVNLSFNLRLVKNFYAGAGYQNTLLRNNDMFKFIYFGHGLPYHTRLQGNAGYARLGYDKYFSDRGYVSYALNAGVSSLNYKNVHEDTSAANRPYGLMRFRGTYVQPELTVNFIADAHVAFSLMISYTTVFSHYDPKGPRFNQFSEVRNASNKAVMSWINFGFGFNVLIGK